MIQSSLLKGDSRVIMENQKKMKWQTLCFMCFSTLWGFGNVLNGFAYFNGIQVIFSWILMFALYFVPYALMVGELGSAFKEKGGGVTSWISETCGSKIAYYAGWTYFAVHITYIVSKSTGALKAASWLVFQNGTTYNTFPTIYVQGAALILLLVFAWIASRGLNPLKKLATLAGTSMFVMSILYIIMMFGAKAMFPNAGYVSMDFSLKNLVPSFNVEYFTSLSILVFAVGGCEKISPYVNKVENASKGFPKAMIAVAIMVAVCALLGTVAMGMMFPAIAQGGEGTLLNGETITSTSFIANGSYLSFQLLGQYYGMGNVLMIIYAACNLIGQLSTLVISIDAPLRMFLDDATTQNMVPKSMLKQNQYGAYVNGILLIVVLSSILIAAQMLVPGADEVLKQLTKLNSVCMPLRYLWVFAAYIMLRKATDRFPREYQFVKNNKLAVGLGAWCFLVTAACCIMGMYSTDIFTMILNVLTPFVLIMLGLIMPYIRKRQDAKEAA